MVSTNGHLSKVPLHLNGTPCGLAWNGREWLVETFIPDSVVVQTPNGSVLFRFHSYDCRGFAYFNRTYYVPISESAMMGDCSLLLVSPNGSVERRIPCGFINGVRVKIVGKKLYLMNCTGIYVYSNGAFKRALQLDNWAEDFDVLNDKILLCSNGLIEHSKNGTREITDSCDAISCNGWECLIASNGALYIYDGNLSTLEIEENTRNINPKTVAVGVFLVFLTIWLLMRRKSA
ncbi:hypothetical protein FH039_08190 [Thermococcus indicus]|uniref:Uncharacterized protein n=1 Tax=Thermococcus indicus TaxID=2586643 RepID=A0A4Y5SL08_9EURY|nr:hypothetical protein [Thermococcus indicus]QDA31583.1 hypothetical protein FH039_08190 [Thermococcus indicus]